MRWMRLIAALYVHTLCLFGCVESSTTGTKSKSEGSIKEAGDKSSKMGKSKDTTKDQPKSDNSPSANIPVSQW